MILRDHHLRRYPGVFRAMTGLTVAEFDALVADLLPRYAAAERARLARPGRRRTLGGGRKFTLARRDRLLATVVWLRRYPTYPVLGFLCGVSEPTARRAVARALPLLEAAGCDAMRLPDPGTGHRRDLDALLAETPELAVIIDTFEQRVRRPEGRAEADAYYSGKKRCHTLKSQPAVDERDGRVVDAASSVRGPTHDPTLLKESGLLPRLPADVGALGDLAYLGSAAAHPPGLGATPRRKPRGRPRPPTDVAYNTAFARRRIVVEHAIRRVRVFEALAQTDRHHRRHHAARVRAVCGLVNRQLPGCHAA